MQNGKENFKEFMKTIREKVRDWWASYNRKLWTARILVYGGLLLLVIFVGAILFAKFNLFHTDADSARYMLSALVQSQAAIVAIVITLTLIAVQLTASAYSPRVVDIFKKNPDMWILLILYGLSIFYGLLVLKMIRAGDLRQITFLNTPLEYHIFSAYFVGAFTFFMLFPYMWNIISLLKSENIIKRLSEDITKDKILSYIKFAKTSEGVKTSTVDDPVQPIVDIIHGSIMKYDLETTRVGLKAVTYQVIKVIDSDEEKEISEHFCEHLRRVGRLAISREDVESTIEVIENIVNFAKSTAEKELEDATKQAAWSLGEVGRTAIEKGLEDAAWEAVMFLGDIGRTAAEKELEDATRQAVRSLDAVGGDAAREGLEHVTLGAAVTLRDVGEAAVERGLEKAIRSAAMSLEAVGRIAAEKGLEDATWEAAKYLAELTILSEEIVKTTIQSYEWIIEEKDHDSFKKFMEIYEQELEELRAEK